MYPKLLELKDLQKGKIYTCSLSNNNVLITEIYSNDQFEVTSAKGQTYNPVTGDYGTISVINLQLKHKVRTQNIARDVKYQLTRHKEQINFKFTQETGTLNANIHTCLTQIMEIRKDLDKVIDK